MRIWTDVKDRQQIWEYNSKTIVSKKFLKEYTGTSYKLIVEAGDLDDAFGICKY